MCVCERERERERGGERVTSFFHQTDILRIDNLWQFTNLRRLQLDNNIIEEIPAKALTMLTQLEWLDLSFNNIEEISGLDTLVHLRDLSLAHNRIKTVGGLDALKKLQVLSLANNLIEETTEWNNVRGSSLQYSMLHTTYAVGWGPCSMFRLKC